MTSSTISIFKNKIFLEIIKEISLFSEFTIKHYEDIDVCVHDAKKNNSIIIFFNNEKNINHLTKITSNNFPIIVINENFIKKDSFENHKKNKSIEELNIPFTIFDFKKNVISLFAKFEFKKNSLINLHDYLIDKNERKIKKNNIELQLSEKEINFLILFSKNKKPISRNFFLKNVWNYSPKSETHTVETHIHRLRKKILEKFGDNNFIKNNKKGYYI